MEQTIPNGVHTMLPPADWAGEIERLKAEISNERDRNLRTLADFKNYRRRIERDGITMAEEGKREVFRGLLEIIDDIEKAQQWTESNNSDFVKGMRIIHQKFLSLLEANRVVPFQSVGRMFDPAQHESLSLVKAQGVHSGMIVDELRRGYSMNNTLLRAAQVRVSK
ncbi:MAG: nucleotide exchange factor GrpE [Bacteroidota bacterium]|jgi:molecular chaperone GrpE